MHPCVTISLVEEVRGGPFVFWHDLARHVALARDIGFPAVEVFPRGPTDFPQDELRRALAASDTALAAMGTGAGWVVHRLHLTHAEPRVRQEARDFIRHIIDLAGGFGAPTIIGSMQGRWGDGTSRDTAIAHLRDALEFLGEHAAQYGVPVLYEPLNRYETNLFTTQQAAASFLQQLTTRNVKLLCDFFHMNIEEVDLAATLRDVAAHIGHVHFVDSNRRPVGCGHLELEPAVRALRQIGYTGYLSAEAFPYPDPEAAARQTLTAFRALTTR